MSKNLELVRILSKRSRAVIGDMDLAERDLEKVTQEVFTHYDQGKISRREARQILKRIDILKEELKKKERKNLKGP